MSDQAIRILAVIPQLSRGGASRALIAEAKHCGELGNFSHVVVSLLPPDRRALETATAAGTRVLCAPDRHALERAIADADIVRFEYWNAPELTELLAQPLPPMRVMVRFMINGLHPPHVMTPGLVDLADAFVASSPTTLDLPHVQSAGPDRPDLVYSGTDFSRLDGLQPIAHETFNVGYVGTVDFAKMHPDMVAMHCAIDIPTARFVIRGDGKALSTLRRQVSERREDGRFDIAGHVEDVRSVYGRLDVFGYPLCEGNFSASELVLQEAMYAGIPPVVLPHGGAAQLIVDGESGLVARDGAAYAAAIRHLFRNPGERARLGRNAAIRARTMYGARNAAGSLAAIYERMMQAPKRERECIDAPADERLEGTERGRGAALLIVSLGEHAGDFAASVAAHSDGSAIDAERRIADATPALGDCILQYRNRFPDDGHIALWAGLILLRRDRPALAAMSFRRAMELGRNHWRLQWYLARAASAAGSPAMAEAALATVLAAVPQFGARWS